MTDTHFEPTYSLVSFEAVRHRPWFSLRKLLLLLVLMAAAPLMLLEIVSSQREQAETVAQAQDSIAELAGLIAGRNERVVEGVGQLLTAIAEAPGLGGADRAACSAYLRRVLSRQTASLNFGLVGLDGRLVCDATAGAVNLDAGARDVLAAALKDGQLAVGAYPTSPLTGPPSLLLARPVAGPDGAARGVVFATMDVKTLADSLQGASAVPGANVQLVDRAFVVLASSDALASPVGQALVDTVMRDAVRSRRSGQVEGAAREQPARLRSLYPVKLRGEGVLFVTVTVPTDRIVAPVLQGFQRRLAAILAIALAAAGLVWVTGNRLVVRPLERLIGGLRHVESGDYAQALRKTRFSLRELDDLQHSLGTLVIGLEAQHYERDQALGALSEREARYRELFQANPQVMYVYDVRSLQFLAVNDAASAFYGYSHDEFLDLTVLDILPEPERAERLDHPTGRGPAAAQANPRVWTHQLKNGVTRQVEVMVSSTVFEGFAAELAMVTDITARLAAEARVRESGERLEQRVAERTRELQLANQELEAFSYSVSHDLRNPLGAVGMFGQMLSAHLGETVDAQGQLYLARIEQGVRGMERLIDDLMALAQVTRTELQVVSVDLTAVCRDVLKELRESEPQRRVEVTLEDGLACSGDAGLLRRMMANLIGNAWKFTSRTPDARIHIGRQQGDPAGSAPVFFVQDNGAGFDMKYAGRLFLSFERLHGDHDFPGTGVGLATVQRIVARHGGRIWAEAAVDQGATFRFVINPSSNG
jgi:PAS domain S-box-containing protein